MIFADYGESLPGPHQPGYQKVDKLSRRQANGMLVYDPSGRAATPALPSNFKPVQIGTTESVTPKSATAPTRKDATISLKSTTMPSTYRQTVTMPAPKPTPTTTANPPYNPAAVPAAVPTLPSGQQTASAPVTTPSTVPGPPRTNSIFFPPQVYDDVGQVLTTPKKSNVGWYVAGGIGLAAIIGGAYFAFRR